MAKLPTAGSLRERVAFDARVDADDGYGNTKAEFVQQFECSAEFRPRGGSEAVIAARREGRNVFGVYVRSSIQSRQLTSDWRMRRLRKAREEVFAIDIVDTFTDAGWVYLEVTSGVAQ